MNNKSDTQKLLPLIRYTLPKGEEDDWLDDAKFENWVIWTEELSGGKIEEEQSIQSQTDGNVVDDSDVQVATCWPRHISKYVACLLIFLLRL